MQKNIIFDIDTGDILSELNLFDNNEVIITSSKFNEVNIQENILLLEEPAISIMIMPIY